MRKQALGMLPAAEQADVDLWEAHDSFLRGKQHVAGRGDRQSRTQRRAVDGGDHRLGALQNGMIAFARTAVVLPALAGFGLVRP